MKKKSGSVEKFSSISTLRIPKNDVDDSDDDGEFFDMRRHMWRSLRHRVKGLSLKDKVITAHVVFIDSISIRPPLTSSRFCENTFKFFNRIIRVRTRKKDANIEVSKRRSHCRRWRFKTCHPRCCSQTDIGRRRQCGELTGSEETSRNRNSKKERRKVFMLFTRQRNCVRVNLFSGIRPF